MSEVELQPHAYVLAVHDLPGSTAYFTDVLGFTKEWDEPGNWQGLIRGRVRVMLGRCPDAMPPREARYHNYFGFFAADDVDALTAEFRAKGAIILSGPEDKPWGWRELAVATPEGHRMMFAQPLEDNMQGNGAGVNRPRPSSQQ